SSSFSSSFSLSFLHSQNWKSTETISSSRWTRTMRSKCAEREAKMQSKRTMSPRTREDSAWMSNLQFTELCLYLLSLIPG
ncbi:hypothetical protein PMAYCL1PPCAC_28904, partial [Pristionchus mayeri]